MPDRLLQAVRESVGDDSIEQVVRLGHRSWRRRVVRWTSGLFVVVGLTVSVPLVLLALVPLSALDWVWSRHVILGLREHGAIAFDQRSISASVGPDHFVLAPDDIAPLGQRPASVFRRAPWRVMDIDVVAARGDDRRLRRWLAAGVP